MLLVNFEGMEYTLFVNDERASIFTGRSSYTPNDAPPTSPDQPLNHPTVNIGQAAINTVLSKGQLLVIDPQQFHHGGVDIIDLGGMIAILRLKPKLIALTNGDPALDPPAGQPVREHVGIMIAPLLPLARRHPAKLRRPKNQGLIEHPPLFKIFDLGRRSDRHPA